MYFGLFITTLDLQGILTKALEPRFAIPWSTGRATSEFSKSVPELPRYHSTVPELTFTQPKPAGPGLSLPEDVCSETLGAPPWVPTSKY